MITFYFVLAFHLLLSYVSRPCAEDDGCYHPENTSYIVAVLCPLNALITLFIYVFIWMIIDALVQILY